MSQELIYSTHIYGKIERFKEILRMQKLPTSFLRGTFYILKRNLNYAKIQFAIYENYLVEEYSKLCDIVKYKFKKILRMQKLPTSFLRGTFYILKRNLNYTKIQFAIYGNYLIEEYSKFCDIVKYKFKKILRMQKLPIQILVGTFCILKRNLNYAKIQFAIYGNYLVEEYSKFCDIVKYKFKKILRMQKLPTKIQVGTFYILKRNLNSEITILKDS